MSLDEFYALVTGQQDAFCQMCMALPCVVEEAVNNIDIAATPIDTVFSELSGIANNKDGSFAPALYLLGFKDYIGFGGMLPPASS